MSVLDLYNNTRELANNTINNLAQTQAYTPKRNLEEAYNRAMGKTTPNWAINLSNAMPSIGEIVANATIKNGFQQRPVAESLERQKQRQQAYNQWLQENEQNQAKDFVQIAKEQLGMDMAQDDREYGRNLNELKRAEELERQKRAYQQYEEQQRIAEEQRKFDNDIKAREIALKEAVANAKPTELTEDQKLQNEIAKLEAVENAKAKIQAEQDVNKAKAEYEAFKSNIDNLKNLSKASGTTVDRAIGGFAGLFSGKSNNPLTRPNDSMKEVKAQLTNAIYRANGVDGDKISKEQSKMILAQAGMPDSMNLTQSQVDTIIKNIENIYKQRISGKQNFANSFNSVSWE